MDRNQTNSPILAIMELANLVSAPMSLNAVIKLKVVDAIWQGGSNNPLSAAEILSAVAVGPDADAENLQRILRLLTSYGVFNEHIGKDGSQRRYSLTEVGKALATDENGLSYAPYILQHHQDAIMLAWPLVHEAVLDPSCEPFVKVHGELPYSYYGKYPKMNLLMQKAMSGVSVLFMKAFLDGYDGFQGVETLVDVGGSSGDCLRMIMSKHQNIKKGVNFDLPEVVEKAPRIPGIEHVGGDVLKSVPPGDAIFMKWILVSWTDDECKQILKNCFDALPPGGKLIMCDPLLPDRTDDSHSSRAILEADIYIMTMYRTKGKHRTKMECQELGHAAGFHTLKASFNVDGYFTVLEFQK